MTHPLQEARAAALRDLPYVERVKRHALTGRHYITLRGDTPDPKRSCTVYLRRDNLVCELGGYARVLTLSDAHAQGPGGLWSSLTQLHAWAVAHGTAGAWHVGGFEARLRS